MVYLEVIMNIIPITKMKEDASFFLYKQYSIEIIKIIIN